VAEALFTGEALGLRGEASKRAQKIAFLNDPVLRRSGIRA
jgi:hypothetical protein